MILNLLQILQDFYKQKTKDLSIEFSVLQIINPKIMFSKYRVETIIYIYKNNEYTKLFSVNSVLNYKDINLNNQEIYNELLIKILNHVNNGI